MPITFSLRPVSWLGLPTDNIRCPRVSAPLRYPDFELGGSQREVHYNVQGAPEVSKVAALGDHVRVIGADGEVLLESRAGTPIAPSHSARDTDVAVAMDVWTRFNLERAAGRLV